jgi:hypothetical protein
MTGMGGTERRIGAAQGAIATGAAGAGGGGAEGLGDVGHLQKKYSTDVLWFKWFSCD